MPPFRRYAVYVLPDPARASWARFAAAWLGRDILKDVSLAHPDCPGLPWPPAEITARPRRYGLHATIKAPFRPAPGVDEATLCVDLRALAARLAPVDVPGLRLAPLGRFLALVPDPGDGTQATALSDLAAGVVRGLDHRRAPEDAADLARRRGAGLDARGEELLQRWGYPHVMERFRFHITLTGRLARGDLAAVHDVLAARLGPLLPAGFTVDTLWLLGEDDAGLFHPVCPAPLGRPRASVD